MKLVFAVCLAAIVVLQPARASAQTCENYIPVIADGRIVDSMAAPSPQRILDRMKAFG